MSITDAIREIQWWLRLATFLVCPLQIALLFVLHNKGNRIDYSGLPEDETELYKEFLRRKVEIDKLVKDGVLNKAQHDTLLPPCLLYTSPSPRDKRQSRMPSSA